MAPGLIFHYLANKNSFIEDSFHFTYKVLTTTQPSYLHSLGTVQPSRSTRSSSVVTLARPSTSSSLRISDFVLQLVSGIDFQLLSVNHALISRVPTHPILRVALLPLVPVTRHSRHPSPHHTFIPGLKPFFSANPSHRSLPFFSSGLTPRIPRGQFTDTSEHIRFLLFSFSVFPLSVVGSTR